MKIQNYILVIIGLISIASCKKYLDVIPDNVATEDHAFQRRHEAEKFLFTCYSYMPNHGHWQTNPAILGGDEIWIKYPQNDPGMAAVWGPFYRLARGEQNVVSPIGDFWSNGDNSYFKAIRDCNTFLDRIHEVPDIEPFERIRWIAEVEFLKAFYHWNLFRMYGPIPIMDKNPPISVTPEDAQVARQPVDSCINYIVNLIDTASSKLPDQVNDLTNELGRVTKTIALSIKARVLVTAASPLFNGNADFAALKNNDGTQLFNTTVDPQKWVRAAQACKEAIDQCHASGLELYRFNPSLNIYNLHPEMQVQMDIRSAITEKWNSELIWGNSNSQVIDLQDMAAEAYNQNTSNASSFWGGELAPPLKIAKMFYSKNGVPIDEDKTLDFNVINELRVATVDERFNIFPGYQTARLNFDREPRFYADLGFDGSIWYGAGNFVDTAAWHLEMKKGQYSTRRGGALTGYLPKKLAHFQNTWTNSSSRSRTPYPWPIMRLADLYLLYAESLNESNSVAEAITWINLVRDRAGIPSVEHSWSNYSIRPADYQNQAGLRRIIQRERMIELVFEGQRFWDLKRWKEAERLLNEPIQGWDNQQEDAIPYYQVRTIFDQKFGKRDYFWPIKEHDLIVNKNLVQNIGW